MSGPNWHIVFHRDPRRWLLKEEGTHRILRTRNRKAELIEEAAEMGRLAGASVRIHKMDGRIQEERTYRTDPRRSRG
jgi:hypothetical protein